MHTNMLLDEIKVCDVLVIKEVLFSCDRDNTVFCKHFLDKIAKYFWTLLQNVFGHCCMSKLDKVAMSRLAT